MIGLEIITSAVNNSMQTMVCPCAVDKKSWFAIGNAQLDSGFLELYSRLQSSDFRFHKKKLSDPGFHEQKFSGSRIRIIL